MYVYQVANWAIFADVPSACNRHGMQPRCYVIVHRKSIFSSQAQGVYFNQKQALL